MVVHSSLPNTTQLPPSSLPLAKFIQQQTIHFSSLAMHPLPSQTSPSQHLNQPSSPSPSSPSQTITSKMPTSQSLPPSPSPTPLSPLSFLSAIPSYFLLRFPLSLPLPLSIYIANPILTSKSTSISISQTPSSPTSPLPNPLDLFHPFLLAHSILSSQPPLPLLYLPPTPTPIQSPLSPFAHPSPSTQPSSSTLTTPSMAPFSPTSTTHSLLFIPSTPPLSIKHVLQPMLLLYM
ncbi:uncharacterized protein MONOS_2309 [Monocercomonoides exilis]|uniref:uncharacterized protein n=1 Tax=Monocercomonoides exilis TaxID=2049356 RepID=UPI00355A4F85|nr:hypothetical protein MONOS_2309 [Monocercomonoides exilis]|eukprot:MONOS_2309.1-p1 / transcript=MONOS_2309.1 / gene=MONOS_2309 / organism=Monocercomonoides_exilis_PA203 / gene_product=unspecified product / transcript_product=unspecified product / location=Mono_scaffold00047:64574-65275(-) / protein_length=234 / sequence_SO=supercontig / SO=protein_coding / is_pseudo=false